MGRAGGAETLKALGTERAWVAHGDGYRRNHHDRRDACPGTRRAASCEQASRSPRRRSAWPYRNARICAAATRPSALRRCAAAARRRAGRLSRHGADECRRRAGRCRQGRVASPTAWPLPRPAIDSKQGARASLDRARRDLKRVSRWPTSCARSRPTSAEIAAAKARVPPAEIKAERATQTSRAVSSRACEAKQRGRPVRADRRGQEGKPVQGADPRRFRPAGAGPRLCGRWRGLSVQC